MKAIVWMLVLLGAGWAGVYFFGGYRSFDPSAQGQEKRSKIQAGMSYAKVFDEITGDPRKYSIINLKKEQGMEVLVPSAEVNFERGRVDDHIKNNTLPHGFTATFNYSSSVAFTVTFDGKGNVVGLGDALTHADMFQMPKPVGKVIEPGLDPALGDDEEPEGDALEAEDGEEEEPEHPER
jgi:hypothetical protein